MQLFVLRHAIAEHAAEGQDDASRALTPAGIDKLRRGVRGLRALDIAFDRVLTSPWLRARDTARLLAPISAGPPIETALLAQPPRPELLELLAERDDDTAVVGHEPWLTELLGWLAFGQPRHGEGLRLKKAGVAWLEGSPVPGGMILRALLPPGVVRAVR